MRPAQGDQGSYYYDQHLSRVRKGAKPVAHDDLFTGDDAQD
ncbi:MAG: hypothetical protein Q8O43_04165 [Dehalococcoidia bacterium]|nr:hypothetical protein [Dehalococcoidia bacterium]